MSRLTSAEAGTRIWDALAGHPGGLNRRMVCFHANVSPSQLRRGLDWINDLFEDDADAPIITLYRGKEYIYTLAALERDAREYWERHLRGQITRARREHNKWHKTFLRFPSPENERQEELSRRRVLDLRYSYDLLFGRAQESLQL